MINPTTPWPFPPPWTPLPIISIMLIDKCPKDTLDPEKKCVVVYDCKCKDCGQLYVGKTETLLGERSEEHDKSVVEDDSKSALSQYQMKTGHVVTSKPMTLQPVQTTANTCITQAPSIVPL